MGNKIFEFGAGESLIITANVPTVSRIIAASRNEPYLAFVVELNPALIESLVVEMGTAPFYCWRAFAGGVHRKRGNRRSPALASPP